MEDTLELSPVITSAVLQGALGRVVFSCLSTDDSVSTFIEYDYVNNVWTVVPRVAGTGAISAAMVGDIAGTVPSYIWVTAAAGIWRQTFDWLDNSTYKTIRLTSPWVHVQGLTGWQHVDTIALLAESATDHELTISIAYDYSSTYADTKTWTAAQINALATSREMLRMDLLQPECVAFSVRIEDAAPAVGSTLGAGKGPVLIGIQLLASADDDLAKLPEGNRK